jgi:nitrogen regulatory protein P-II 1
MRTNMIRLLKPAKSQVQKCIAFHTRGTPGQKSFKLLSVVVEPAKELILTLVPQSKTKKVLDQIIKNADLDNPDNGFAFVFEVKELGGFSSLLKE